MHLTLFFSFSPSGFFNFSVFIAKNKMKVFVLFTDTNILIEYPKEVPLDIPTQELKTIKPLTTIDMKECVVRPIEVVGHPFCFAITKKSKDIVLEAASCDVAQKWITHLMVGFSFSLLILSMTLRTNQ